ncbi:MAG: WbqC family protein [Planctomycetota bacterium]
MICAVHQPQYLPWPGYLSKLDAADVFVLYDDTQYKHNEWQNRNRIKTANGVQWLTVPVHHHSDERIRDVRIDNRHAWARKHTNALAASYPRADHYGTYGPAFEAILGRRWDRLAELSASTIAALCDAVGFDTPTVRSSELDYRGRATDALVSICEAVGAGTYLSGPGGRAYLEPEKFAAAGLELLFHEFDPPRYPQPFGEFVPGLSAVDLLFNCGRAGAELIRSARRLTEPDGAAVPARTQREPR